MSESTLGPTPVAGDEVGPYRLETVLGAGGMATVFRARDARGGEVAVKVLNPARVPPEEVKRFTREYEALSRMDHKNIVAVHAAGVHEGYPWIAMELVDGTDLGSLIEKWKADPPTDRYERIETLMRGLCHGLQYVHDKGLIHRDIKPGNILVTASGEPKYWDPVCPLQRALYGHPESGAIWEKHLASILEELGWERVRAHPGTWVHRETLALLAVYVEPLVG